MRNSAGKARVRLVGVAISLLMLFVAGCVYQLGSSLPPDLKNVYLPTFVNTSG